MLNSRQNLGKNGEDIAAEFLSKKGYTLLTRNYRCRYGEIDIIAKYRDILVFVEVKTRTGEMYGSPASAVTNRKQRQISKTAQYYLAERNLFDAPARFDVVSIAMSLGQRTQIEIIADAFDLCQE
ncbi:MAG: YraN family protein [Proteobacteria bacterium]|nr:YraN family protein [Pseudomonadota bacterium]